MGKPGNITELLDFNGLYMPFIGKYCQYLANGYLIENIAINGFDYGPVLDWEHIEIAEVRSTLRGAILATCHNVTIYLNNEIPQGKMRINAIRIMSNTELAERAAEQEKISIARIEKIAPIVKNLNQFNDERDEQYPGKDEKTRETYNKVLAIRRKLASEKEKEETAKYGHPCHYPESTIPLEEVLLEIERQRQELNDKE